MSCNRAVRPLRVGQSVCVRSRKHPCRDLPVLSDRGTGSWSQDLGEVYELVYQFIGRGGKLPRFGRRVEGAQAAEVLVDGQVPL